jgi:hypothetical protein
MEKKGKSKKKKKRGSTYGADVLEEGDDLLLRGIGAEDGVDGGDQHLAELARATGAQVWTRV